jgi:hypothetical protein
VLITAFSIIVGVCAISFRTTTKMFEKQMEIEIFLIRAEARSVAKSIFVRKALFQSFTSVCRDGAYRENLAQRVLVCTSLDDTLCEANLLAAFLIRWRNSPSLRRVR